MVGVQKKSVFDYVILVVALTITFSTLYPFVNMFYISVSDMSEVLAKSGMMLYPETFNLNAYQYVFQHGGLGDAFKVTLFITLAGTAVNLVATTLGAYVLSCRDLPGRGFLTTYVLVTMIFHAGIIPNYITVKSLGLINSLWALILPSAVSTFYMIIQRNFFQTLPESLKESARIDGCPEWKILIFIYLPLSLPILATLALFYGVGHWNEYSNAVLYITKPKLSTLQVLVRKMYDVSLEALDYEKLPPPVESIRSATVMVVTVPIILVYPFLQRYFVQGLTLGSVKG